MRNPSIQTITFTHSLRIAIKIVDKQVIESPKVWEMD
jgi:hypothetical protein